MVFKNVWYIIVVTELYLAKTCFPHMQQTKCGTTAKADQNHCIRTLNSIISIDSIYKI